MSKVDSPEVQLRRSPTSAYGAGMKENISTADGLHHGTRTVTGTRKLRQVIRYGNRVPRPESHAATKRETWLIPRPEKLRAFPCLTAGMIAATAKGLSHRSQRP